MMAAVLDRLPAPARVPDVESDLRAALLMRDAIERSGFGRGPARVSTSAETMRIPTNIESTRAA